MFFKHDQLGWMTGLASFLAMLGLGSPVLADQLGKWNGQRAQLFSSVCMKSAPSFAEFAVLADRAGFKRSSENGLQDELFFPPEVVVSLQSVSGTCQCLMTAGAPDQSAMAVAIFKRLVADFPKGVSDKAQGGGEGGTVFHVDGVDVRVQLAAKTTNQQPWIYATASTEGACPK